MTEIIAVFAPLLGFLIAFLFGKKIGDRGAQVVTCGLLIAAAAASISLFFDVALGGNERTIILSEWISIGGFDVNWALRLDTLSVVMMNVITIVSACVHVYSVGYMSHDPHKARFMSYLSLFTFAMLMLVTADNLVQLFFGWEGVGLASYLLIGFWNQKNTANAAAIKAFIVNRIGDVCLALGIFTLFVLFGSVQFDEIFAAAPQATLVTFNFLGFEVHALTLACLLLFIGACGKSAQLGLHTWLPDAMEGPTPVSALIHAATMVTAGVFLVARFSPVFEYAPIALMVVCIVGALTALIAATIGMTQFDIKRVIAYSTMSQLGYMFFALGVSAYGAAMFHLTTHAFFKALLFLGAGSVIHAMSDEQDMRNMGGIWKKIPVTYAFMWIGSLALAGIPVFAGFYSKDMILEAAWADQTWFGETAYWLGVAAALMTAFYSWRLLLMTFHGKPRASEEVMSHIHESPAVMTVPLAVLAIGAIFSGMILYQPFVGSAHKHGGDTHAEVHYLEPHAGEESASSVIKAPDPNAHEDILHSAPPAIHSKEDFWRGSLFVLPENDTVEAAHSVPKWVKYLPVAIAALGILLGYVAYLWIEGLGAKIARMAGPINTLFFRKWYFDEIYDALVTKPSIGLGQVFSKGDRVVIDGLGPDGFASASKRFGKALRTFQSGYVFQYAFVMMISVIGLISWIILNAS